VLARLLLRAVGQLPPEARFGVVRSAIMDCKFTDLVDPETAPPFPLDIRAPEG
jgi:hypothetical protein